MDATNLNAIPSNLILMIIIKNNKDRTVQNKKNVKQREKNMKPHTQIKKSFILKIYGSHSNVSNE